MKVLLCHNYYLQRGGEDQSFEEERDLLGANGHDVVEYVRSNEELVGASAFAAAGKTLWNRRAARDVSRLIQRERPDVFHCTNSFPLLSPAVCHAAHRAGVAVVQALRNYRLLCAGAYLMRDGRPCEDCISRLTPWPAVVHRCYRGSVAASATVAAMQMLHRSLGTWRRRVDAFFTLTEFARGKFVEAGFPAALVHVKHNSVSAGSGVGIGSGGHIAFAGRLSPEKGVTTLLDAWRLDQTLPPLRIIGDGPLAAAVREAAMSDERIEWLGALPNAQTRRVIGEAAALLMPSVWYETFGRTIAEAYAAGTPVIASRLGAMQELVEEGGTGWLFAPGDPRDLAATVRRSQSLPECDVIACRRNARAAYESCFTPAHNYRRLLEIYGAAIESSRRRTRGRQRSAPILQAEPQDSLDRAAQPSADELLPGGGWTEVAPSAPQHTSMIEGVLS